MSNIFYPKAEKTSMILISDTIKDYSYVHIVLPELQNSVKAILVRTARYYPSENSNNDVYNCTDFEKYERPHNKNSSDHQEDTFVLKNEYTYIRLPLDITEGTVLNLVTKYSYDCEVLEITFISVEEDMPFSDNVIRDSRSYISVDYFGSDDYWKPEVAHRYIVSGHENCNWGECDSYCQVVSCGIQQGYESASCEEISFLRTTINDK